MPRAVAVNASLIKCPAPKHRYSSLPLDETSGPTPNPTPNLADTPHTAAIFVPSAAEFVAKKLAISILDEICI